MDTRFETLTMRHILEGLNHNLNTPLNLILGYAQQLQGSYSGDPYLQKIIDAGLKIDRQLTDVMQAVHGRLFQETELLELNDWLQREISFLCCDLKIKRSVVFQKRNDPSPITIHASRPRLSLAFETIILSLRDFFVQPAIHLALALEDSPEHAILLLSCNGESAMSSGAIEETIVQRISGALQPWGESDWASHLKVRAESDPATGFNIIKLIIARKND